MKIAFVVVGGILYALALPPFDWAVCGWLTLVPLLLAIRDEPLWSAARYGILYGYVAAWAATWCFADAAAHYFLVQLPLAVAGMVAWYLAVAGVPFGLFAAGVSLLRGTPLPPQFIVAILWVATELIRGRLFGQPWGLLGYTQHAQLPLIQVAAVTGVYGVSFLAALGNAALAEAIWRLRTGCPWPRAAATLAVPSLLIGTVWVAGSVIEHVGRLANAPRRQIAVVQTDLAPAFHWTRSYTQRQLRAHIDATDSLSPSVRPALIVWPENAVPRYLEREPAVAFQLAQVARRHGADLLLGGPRYDGGRVYNSARLINAAGEYVGHYDKRELVIFAEQKPFSPKDGRLEESPEQFSPGTGSGVMRSFALLGVSICYEIVFPELIDAAVRDGAELLVNVSNDAWIDGGYGTASPQFLAMATFRAVETRRYLVRANTTGHSAVIDPYGRRVASLEPETSAVLTAPVAGRRGLTPYVRLGDAFALVCVLAVIAAFLAPRLIWRRRSQLAPARLAA